MKVKNLTTLAIVLVAIIGIIIVANQLQNRKPSEESLVFLPQYSPSTCGKILIVEGKDSAIIAKTGTAWFVETHVTGAAAPAAAPAVSPVGQPAAAAVAAAGVEQYPADSAAIQTALDKLKSLSKADLISQNAQKQSELEVDTAKGIYVQAWNDKGTSVASFYIGKSGANWDSHFIREKGSNDVYLATGSIRYSFFGDKKRWKDKSVIKFDKAFVKDVKIIRKDSGSVELVKTAPTPTDTAIKEGWQIVGAQKAKAKKDKVEEILNNFSKLTANDFETAALTPDSMGFTKPLLVVSATLQSGETKTIIAGKKKGSNEYWVKNPENTKAIFIVGESNVNALNVGENAVKEGVEPPKPATASAAPVAFKKEAKVKTSVKKK